VRADNGLNYGGQLNDDRYTTLICYCLSTTKAGSNAPNGRGRHINNNNNEPQSWCADEVNGRNGFCWKLFERIEALQRKSKACSVSN